MTHKLKADQLKAPSHVVIHVVIVRDPSPTNVLRMGVGSSLSTY